MRPADFLLDRESAVRSGLGLINQLNTALTEPVQTHRGAGLRLASRRVDHHTADLREYGKSQQKRKPLHAFTAFIGFPHSPQNFNSFSNEAPHSGHLYGGPPGLRPTSTSAFFGA